MANLPFLLDYTGDMSIKRDETQAQGRIAARSTPQLITAHVIHSAASVGPQPSFPGWFFRGKKNKIPDCDKNTHLRLLLYHRETPQTHTHRICLLEGPREATLLRCMNKYMRLPFLQPWLNLQQGLHNNTSTGFHFIFPTLIIVTFHYIAAF